MKITTSWVAMFAWLLTAGQGLAGVYKTKKEALSEAFPGGYERKTVFLTGEQVREVEGQARARLESKILTYYVGRSAEGERAGTAFFDTHTVRTTVEVLFVCIDPEGRVVRSEILAFYEPEDYKVRQSWLDRMEGKGRDDELTVGRDLDGVTGATLTVRALSAAVRRCLALNIVVSGEEIDE